MEVLVCLADTGDSKHEVGKDTSHIDGMCGGDPEKSLKIERVQLADQKLYKKGGSG